MPLRSRPAFALPGPRKVVVLVMLACLATAIIPNVSTLARAPAPHQLPQFLWGLAGQESGWNYYERNPSSEAFGRYQVMPANWPSWAARYLGSSYADPNPLDQELVVRGKVADLYRWLGSWRRVAYWWLTGSKVSHESKWSAMGLRYVDNVMSLMARAPKGGTGLPPGPADRATPVAAGDWRVVSHDVRITDRNDARRRAVGNLRNDSLVRVDRVEWGGKGHVLWLRVEAISGRTGWLGMTDTLPARRPANASDWKHNGNGRGGGGGGGGGGGDPTPDPRSHARPRPH